MCTQKCVMVIARNLSVLVSDCLRSAEQAAVCRQHSARALHNTCKHMRIRRRACRALQDPAAAEGAGVAAGGDAAGVGAATAGGPPLVRLRQAAAPGPQRQPRGVCATFPSR